MAREGRTDDADATKALTDAERARFKFQRGEAPYNKREARHTKKVGPVYEGQVRNTKALIPKTGHELEMRSI